MAHQIDTSVNQRFTSRWTFLLSVLGIAVGTGNIWRFPRIAASNGGDEGAGAFLIAWVVFLFLWSIPLIIAEYALGRKSRMSTVGTFASLVGRNHAWMGAFVAFVATAITFFYTVVVGWCLFYFVEMLINPLPLTEEAARSVWNSYQGGGWPLFFHAVAMVLGALAIWRGVASIEKINTWLIPALLLIVLVSVVRALTLPGALEGVAYLFTPEWKQLLKPRIWLEALTQNAWDTGAGWGLFLTYAAYIRREHGLVKNAFTTGIGNNTVSLLAALMVFGTAFSVLGTQMNRPEVLEIMRDSGPACTGLTFIWMPQLFAKMVFGKYLAVLFFLGLSMAGFSSLIAQLELPARVLIDAGMKRSSAVITVGVGGYVLGIPSALYLNFLGNQDFVWGVALAISGALIAFAVVRHGAGKIRREEILADRNDWKLGRWWEVVLKYFVPLAALVLLIGFFTAEPGQWYNPFQPFSAMTCLVQWSLVLVVLLALNRWLARRTLGSGP